FGIVVVAKNTAAHAPHHLSMPMHKGCKSRLVTAAHVVLQQLPIGQSRTIAQNPAKMLDDPVQFSGRHVLSFVGATTALYLNTTRRQRFDTLFFAAARGRPANLYMVSGGKGTSWILKAARKRGRSSFLNGQRKRAASPFLPAEFAYSQCYHLGGRRRLDGDD